MHVPTITFLKYKLSSRDVDKTDIQIMLFRGPNMVRVLTVQLWPELKSLKHGPKIVCQLDLLATFIVCILLCIIIYGILNVSVDAAVLQ
jgi:hypothetical protein